MCTIPLHPAGMVACWRAMLDLLLYAFLPALAGSVGACLLLWVFSKIWDYAFGARAMRPRVFKR